MVISDAFWAFLGSVITVFIIQYGIRQVNKRKVPAEVENLNSDTRNKNGDLVKKYQDVAIKQADENLELEDEKKKLMKEIVELREEMLTMDKRHDEEMATMKEHHDKEIGELKEAMARECRENEMIRDWARRLVLQVESWGLIPVPYDVNEAKKSGLSLGEYGKIQK